jgi:serine/threonine-protein kinase
MEVRLVDPCLHEIFPTPGDRLPVFTAPEVLEGGDVSEPSDVWALGVILYRVISGKLPWAGALLVKLIDQICHSPFSPLPQASTMLLDLLNVFLGKDPILRITAPDIVAHQGPKN